MKTIKILLLLSLVLLIIPLASFGRTSYSRNRVVQSSNYKVRAPLPTPKSGIVCKCVITAGKKICYMYRQ